MTSDKPGASDVDGRAQMKRWLDNWRRVGPILEAERWERLAAMSDEEAQIATRRVLEMWQPAWPNRRGGRAAAPSACVRPRQAPHVTTPPVPDLAAAARDVLSVPMPPACPPA